MRKSKYDPKEEMRRENETRAAMGLPPVPDSFKDLEAKENERRAAMGLAPSPPGVWDPIRVFQEKKEKIKKKKEPSSGDLPLVANANDEISKIEPPTSSESSTSSGSGNAKSYFNSALLSTMKLGSGSFNKMFPALGTLMAALDKKITKRDDDLKTVNASNQENARQVSRASVFLGKIAEAQLRTNELLEKIIQAASAPPTSAPTPIPGSGQGPNVELDLDRRRAPAAPAPAAAGGSRSSVPQTGQTRVAAPAPAPRSMPTGALVAGGLAVAGVAGAAAVASRETPTNQTPEPSAETPNATAATTPSATSTTNQPRELSERQKGMVDRLLRSLQLENDQEAREIAERIAVRIRPSDRLSVDESRLRSAYQATILRQSPIGFTVAGKPVNPNVPLTEKQLATMREGISANGRQLYPPAVLEIYDRQVSGTGSNASPPPSTDSGTRAQGTQTQTPTASVSTTPSATSGAAATPVAQREQAESLASRVLHLKAKDIIFKADNYEFDQPSGGSAVPFTPAVGGAAPAAAASTSSGSVVVSSSSSSTTTTGPAQNTGIQSVVQKITQEFPNINVTSVLRAGSGTSQHAAGNAADLSLRALSQDQRASLLQNIVSGKYGNIGGLGTYNATGDLLHVDTRTGPKMAWGPNRSRTSINETPQWFQSAVTPWMGGAGGTATASQKQEPRPGGEQMATPAAPSPSSGAQIAQASVQSEVATMQSQQVTSPTNESPEQPADPTGSMEQIATSIDPNEPGPVEPADAAQRYAKLFNMAA
jgi:hypothetical protein